MGLFFFPGCAVPPGGWEWRPRPDTPHRAGQHGHGGYRAVLGLGRAKKNVLSGGLLGYGLHGHLGEGERVLVFF